MSDLDFCWLWSLMPLKQEVDDDAKQMANRSQRGTWWCRVWTHICRHCSLWWSSFQWHVDLISWQSTSYHCTILLIDWNYATKGLARPLWVPIYDLRYRWIAKCSNSTGYNESIETHVAAFAPSSIGVKEFALKYMCNSSDNDSIIALLTSSTSIFLGAWMLRYIRYMASLEWRWWSG